MNILASLLGTGCRIPTCYGRCDRSMLALRVSLCFEALLDELLDLCKLEASNDSLVL